MREFLKGLDLDSETIDTIMAEHGKYITGLKEQNQSYKEEIEGYKNKINELNKSIDEDKKSLESLTSITNERDDYKAQLQMNGANCKKEFMKFVASEVKGMVDDKTDFNTALENYKKENPQYFGENVVKKVQTSPTLNGGNTQPQTTDNIMNDILRGKA